MIDSNSMQRTDSTVICLQLDVDIRHSKIKKVSIRVKVLQHLEKEGNKRLC